MPVALQTQTMFLLVSVISCGQSRELAQNNLVENKIMTVKLLHVFKLKRLGDASRNFL